MPKNTPKKKKARVAAPPPYEASVDNKTINFDNFKESAEVLFKPLMDPKDQSALALPRSMLVGAILMFMNSEGTEGTIKVLEDTIAEIKKSM